MTYYSSNVGPMNAMRPDLAPLMEPEGPTPHIQEGDHDISKINHWGSMVIILGWGDGSMFRTFMRKCSRQIEAKRCIFVVFAEEVADFQYSLKNKLVPDYEITLNMGLEYIADDNDVMLFGHKLSCDHTLIPSFGGLNFLDEHRLNPRAEVARKKWRSLLRRTLEEKLHFPGNCPDDAFDGIRNSILNLPKLISQPATDVLESVLGNGPVFCVGSGPNSQGHIDDLREVQDSAYIICAESAMGALLRSDITPDIVCPMERPPTTTKWCEPAIDTGVWFGGVAVVPPSAVDCFDDRILLVPGADKVVDWYDPGRQLSRMWTGHTTCVLGFSLAQWMCDGDIYLVGQDMSYGPDGQSHWSAVADYKPTDRQYYNGEPCMLPGNCGQEVRSTKIWHTVLTQISEINRQVVTTLGKKPAKSIMAYDKMGAVVPGLDPAPFPKDLPKIDKVDFRKLPKNKDRKEYLKQCLRMLPFDWNNAGNYFQKVFNQASRFGAEHNRSWQYELWALGMAANVIGGSSCYSRPLLRYFLHNTIYNAALQVHIRRQVKSDFQACCRIAESIRSTLGDMCILVKSYQQNVEELCQRSLAILSK